MQVVRGNSYELIGKVDKDTNIFFATTNNVVKKDGNLVMGGGNALALAQIAPELPALFGKKVKQIKGDYYILFERLLNGYFGAFQSKRHYKDTSDIELIRTGAAYLNYHASEYPYFTFHLPVPGIGLGGLKRDEVIEIFKPLPNNVILYYL